MDCLFCERSGDIPQRIFYEGKRAAWFAFLSSPPHTKGHTVLAARRQGRRCPQKFDLQTLGSLGAALSDVVPVLLKYYSVKEVLLTSLRREVKHFHLHLLPVWPDEEKAWRRVTGYPHSHLMEFIGSLEKKRDFLLLDRATKRGKSEEEQRSECTAKLRPDVRALRRMAGHGSHVERH